jgi:hypothetical protein
MEPSAARRAANAASDLDDRTETIYTEVMARVPKARSRAITNDAESDLWDRLVAEARGIAAKGWVVDYGLLDRDPD